MSLKELETAYEVLSQLRDKLSFKEFDDLIYEMRHMEYKMIGLFHREKLITYAGVALQTNFYHKRHLYIFDLVTDKTSGEQKHTDEMLEYLEVYAKTAMCENIVIAGDINRDSFSKFYRSRGFEEEITLFRKKV